MSCKTVRFTLAQSWLSLRIVGDLTQKKFESTLLHVTFSSLKLSRMELDDAWNTIVQEMVTVNFERLIVFEKSKWNNSRDFFLSKFDKLGWKREQEYPFLSFNTRWFLVKEILESVRIFLLIWIFVWK